MVKKIAPEIKISPANILEGLSELIAREDQTLKGLVSNRKCLTAYDLKLSGFQRERADKLDKELKAAYQRATDGYTKIIDAGPSKKGK